MALLENYHLAKCCYLVFGSYLQLIGMKGELGPAYAALSLGLEFVTKNPQELVALKERVEGEGKLWEPVGVLEGYNKFQLLELVDDKGGHVVCVKIWKGEGSSVAAWRKSGFLGGLQLDPSESVRVVQIDGPTGEHAFVDVLIKHSPRKLAKLAALGAFPIVSLRSGLADDGSSFHSFSEPNPPQALLDIVVVKSTEVFLSSKSRSRCLYPPPTRAQHTSTIETITNLDKLGCGDLVHQKKDQNSKTHFLTRAGEYQAEECSNRAVAFVTAVLDGTVGDGGTYNVCQFVAAKPLTPMQEATALVISKPGGAAKAVAYLTPRVGAKHVADLQAFGRELAQRKNEILALAAKAAAPSGSTDRKRRRSA